jgi:hypothetical protein
MSSYGQGQADTHGFGLPWPFNPFYGLDIGFNAYTPDTNVWPDWPANGYILDNSSVDVGALADGLSTNTGALLAKLQTAASLLSAEAQQQLGLATGQAGAGLAGAVMTTRSGAGSAALFSNAPTSTNGLQQVTSWPRCAAFFSLQHSDWPPFPSNPCSNCNTFAFTNDNSSFLVDDTGFSYPQSTNSYQPDGQTPDGLSFPSNALWLEITGLTNGVAYLILHGTTSGSAYTLLSTEALGGPWLVEQDLIGTDGQGWTPIQVPTFGRQKLFFWAHEGTDGGPRVFFLQITGVVGNSVNLQLYSTAAGQTYEVVGKNDLNAADWVSEGLFTGRTNWTPVTVTKSAAQAHFLRARSWIDSDESGLPDWWQLKFFGHLGVDPYGDADQDGWNNLEEFNNGTNPTQPDSGPAPANVTASLDATGTNVIITWDAAAGPVMQYVIYGDYSQVGSASAAARTFTITNADPYDPFFYDQYYSVGAVSTNGTSYSLYVPLTDDQLWCDASIVRGPGEQFYLVVQSPSTNLATIRLYSEYLDYTTYQYHYPSFDVPMSALTNGIALLPASQIGQWQYGTAYARGISTAGKLGGYTELLQSGGVLVGNNWPVREEFVNSTNDMSQNLQFIFRSATVNHGFGIPSFYAEASTNFVYADYLWGVWGFDAMTPAQQNFIWRDFIYNSADLLPYPPYWSTGVGYDTNAQSRVAPSPKYALGGYTNPPPLAFTLDSSSYVYYRNLQVPTDDPAGFAELGLVPYAGGYLGMNTGVKNAYGLAINSVQIINTNLLWTLYPGTIIGPLNTNESSPVFANVAVPSLQNAGYFFNLYDPGYHAPDFSGFSPSQANPILCAGWGQPILVQGWREQALLNGYPGTYGYLQQYFDKAYKVDTNGAVTSQQTAILSQYGELLPTEPGPLAVITLPDASGMRGTSVVQVVKIQFDVNHDGVMDLSLAGPDNTSPDHPFVFWANNNYDRYKLDSDDNTYYEDDLGPKDAGLLPLSGQLPDGYYSTNFLAAIPCMRDLEDYARMWIPGLSSLMAALPTNYTVLLESDSAIRVFRAVEPGGGTNYLFDPVTASNQVANSTALYLGDAFYGNPILLNGRTNLGEHFVFCGQKPGQSYVNLRVLDPGGNDVGGTTSYLQMKDIKDLYERWTVGERPAYPPMDIAQRAAENPPPKWFSYGPPETPFAYPPTTDTNTTYILFVHGWNMETWEKDRFAETAYKRLYWQGYQGRFGSFRWPTENGFKGISSLATNPSEKDNFDRSEYTAWRSGTGLLNKLKDLNAAYAGHVYMLAHSMGNIVAGEALRLAGTNQAVNTYVASQAAVSAHTYDTNIANYSFSYPLLSSQAKTPNIYGNWLSGNYGGGAGTVVNFYNTNDYALQRSAWQLNQLLKPDQFVLLGGTHWDYSYNGLTNDPPPWNHFEKAVSLGFDIVSFDIVNALTNRYEVMGLAAESWTTAFGATPGVQNIRRSIDLSQLWPPDSAHPTHPFDEHFYHSAEFRGDYWQQQGYWTELLRADAFNLK